MAIDASGNPQSTPNYGATGTEGTTLAGGSFYWVASGTPGNGAALADSTGLNEVTERMAG